MSILFYNQRNDVPLNTRVRSHSEVEEPGPRRSEEGSNHPHHREETRLVNPTKFEVQGGDGLLDRKANARQRVSQESRSEATMQNTRLLFL